MGRIQNVELGQSVLTYGTWNVQGLTELKLIEIILSMKRYNIDILCLQETRSVKASVYTEQGHLVITSGTDDGARCWSGVAFVIAPHCKWRIKSYCQVSDRLAYVRLRVPGGILGLITAYAPHNLKSLAERFDFYVALDDTCRMCKANLGKVVAGDFNARIGQRRPLEEEVLGDHCFGREASHRVEAPNRDLLMEFSCASALC